MNTRMYSLNIGPHTTHFWVVVAMKRKPFEQIFVLIQTNTTCRQQMVTTKLAAPQMI